jgi:hypothetical protein
MDNEMDLNDSHHKEQTNNLRRDSIRFDKEVVGDKEREKEKLLSTPDDVHNETSSSSQLANTKHIEWSPENELIMVEWCDIAQCYKWLNARSHGKYSYMHAWFTIPAITLSTITGTASFAITSLPIKYQVYAPMAIGTINIFIGILTTVQQYLKISELNEAHRVSAISWDKFARNIRIELSKSPDERMEAGQFIKISRQEFDRLMETSPSIKDSIINEFNTTFRGKEGSIERKRYEDLKKPDICNTIVSANEYRHPWYLEEHKPIDIELHQMPSSTESKAIEMLRSIKSEQKAAQEKKDKIQKTLQKSMHDLTNRMKQQHKIIEDYITSFQDMYGRKPMIEEITRHCNDIIARGDIDTDNFTKFIDKYDENNMMNIV